MVRAKVIKLVGTRRELLAKLFELIAVESNKKCETFFIREAKKIRNMDQTDQKIFVGLIKTNK